MTAPRSAPRPWLALLATAPALLLAAVQARWCWPFFSDDSFISLRYADRLLTGHGLTWTDGDAVEGYSNLLWVLATAALGACGLDLVTAARLLGGVCTALGLWLLARAAAPRDLRTTLAATAAPLLTAATPQATAWTLGGLEGPMVFLLLCWGLGGLLQRAFETAVAPAGRLLRLGIPFALVCLARPDGALWTATAALAVLVLERRVSAVLRFALPAGAAWTAQLGFRIVYHGDFVPNTAHVKVGLSREVLALGLEYVRDALGVVQGLTLLALFAAILLWRSRPVAADLPWRNMPRAALPVLALPLLAWCAYLLAVGGDHFVAYRLFHPALAPMALLVAAACRCWGSQRSIAFGAALCGAAGAAIDTWRARTESLSAMARSEQWEWQGKAIGETLGRAFADRAPRIAVDAAGAVPFYSRLPAIDMLGLCDRTIATTPVPDWVGPAAKAAGLVRPQGHTHGNGSHVLDLAPDLIQFGQPPGQPLPIFVSGLELELDPRFLGGYRLLRLAHDAMAGPWLWARVDGRVGATRDGDRVEIPAWLFGGFRMPTPIQCRFAWLVGDPNYATGTPAGDARNAAQLALLGWMQSDRDVAALPAPDGRLELDLEHHRAVQLQLPASLLPTDATWQVVFEPADAPWRGEVTGDTVRIEPEAQAPLPAKLRTVVLRRSR